MPRFYIDVCTTFEKVPDRTGRERGDLRQATKLAIRYIRLLVAKASYRHIEFRCLVIRDERGSLVATLPFNSSLIKVPSRLPTRRWRQDVVSELDVYPAELTSVRTERGVARNVSKQRADASGKIERVSK